MGGGRWVVFGGESVLSLSRTRALISGVRGLGSGVGGCFELQVGGAAGDPGEVEDE